MGYTHYFKVKKIPSVKDWVAVIEAVDAILKETDIPIQNNSERMAINLNGVDPDDFETFYIDPLSKMFVGFNFCKTGRRPYDTVVVAILCAINAICGQDFDIGSDGNEADWEAGQTLAQKVSNTFITPIVIVEEN